MCRKNQASATGGIQGSGEKGGNISRRETVVVDEGGKEVTDRVARNTRADTP